MRKHSDKNTSFSSDSFVIFLGGVDLHKIVPHKNKIRKKKNKIRLLRSMAGNAEGNCIQWGQYDVAESFKTEGSKGRQNWIQLHCIIYYLHDTE